MGGNGRMQCHPVLKKPHEETKTWGGFLEEEWSWGEGFAGRGCGGASEGDGWWFCSEWVLF